MEGTQVPALFKAKVDTGDEATISKTVKFRYGYMNAIDVPYISSRTSRVYPSLQVAKASCGSSANIVKVKVEIIYE